MINLEQETREAVGDRTVAYGKVVWCGESDPTAYMYGRAPAADGEAVFKGPEEFLAALTRMNFKYDDGYGGQFVFGTIVFTDGSWLTRGEYDGSEWWENHRCPPLAEVLR